MIQTRFLPILLTAAMIAQSAIVGWGHSHAHLADGSHSAPHVAGHSHDHRAVGGRSHAHHSPEERSLPNRPADTEDCSICRHLALAAIVTLDLEAVVIGDTAESVHEAESSFIPTIAVGLRRPRSPPELS